MGRKEEAVQSFERAIALNPNHVLPKAFLAAVDADLGRRQEADAIAKEILALDPGFSATRLMQSHTFHDPARDRRFVDLLVRAGLPE